MASASRRGLLRMCCCHSGDVGGRVGYHHLHTEAVHGFLAALAVQSRSLGFKVGQLDPPHRASRFFRHGGRLHSVRPDDLGILRRGGRSLSFFLEWERRAVRPVTMAAQLAPYLRYFSSGPPSDDHGAQPVVLVDFDSDLAASHFLRVARRETGRTGVGVPLCVSHRERLEHVGPLGAAWRRPGTLEPEYAFEGPHSGLMGLEGRAGRSRRAGKTALGSPGVGREGYSTGLLRGLPRRRPSDGQK